MSQIELTATLKAVDEASKTMEKVGNSTKKAMDKVKDSSEKAEFSMKKFTTSISGVMTAGYSLYNVYDRVQDAQLAVSKAQNSLTSAQISAKQAQEAYNNAVEKYGVNSEEAKEALEKLELAQERVATAQESLKDKQDRVNEAMVYGAIQIIPTAITAMVNLKGVVYGLTTAMTGLKVASAAAFGVIGAGIAIVAGSAVLTYEAMKETAAWKEKLEVLGMTQEQVDARAQELTATYGNLLKAYTAARQEVEDAYQAFLEQQAAAEDVSETAIQTEASMDALSLTLTDLAMSNEEVITASQDTITALSNVDTALNTLETTVGAMPTFWGEKFGALSEIVSGWASSTKSKINEVVEAFRSAQEEIVGGSIWPEMWEEIERVTKKGIEANVSLIGQGMGGIERGFTPIGLGGYASSHSVTVHSPIIIQGSADKRTVELAVKKMKRELRSVIIEATSSQSSLKRIRK